MRGHSLPLPFICSLFRWSPSFCFNVLVTSFFPWLLRLKDARIATPTACSVHWRTRLVIQSKEWKLALYPEMFEILENLDPPLPLIAGPLMKTNILFFLRLGFSSTCKRQKTCQKQKFSKSAAQNNRWTSKVKTDKRQDIFSRFGNKTIKWGFDRYPLLTLFSDSKNEGKCLRVYSFFFFFEKKGFGLCPCSNKND